MVKKRRQQKKQPAVLKSPISYGLGFLTDEQAEIDKILKQMAERMRAVYEYFKIDPATANAKDDLIFAMCRELFPQAFSLRGGKKRKTTAGSSRQWTVERKLALIRFVKELESAGIKRPEIFELYRRQNPTLGTAASVKARHSEAIKTLKADFNSLEFADQLEFFGMYYRKRRTAELLLGTKIKS